MSEDTTINTPDFKKIVAEILQHAHESGANIWTSVIPGIVMGAVWVTPESKKTGVAFGVTNQVEQTRPPAEHEEYTPIEDPKYNPVLRTSQREFKRAIADVEANNTRVVFDSYDSRYPSLLIEPDLSNAILRKDLMQNLMDLNKL